SLSKRKLEYSSAKQVATWPTRHDRSGVAGGRACKFASVIEAISASVNGPLDVRILVSFSWAWKSVGPRDYQLRFWDVEERELIGSEWVRPGISLILPTC